MPPLAIILGFQLLEPFDLIALEAAVLVAPPIIRYFRYAYRSNRVRYRPTLRHQHIYLPKLRNDLFCCMPLPTHLRIPSVKIILQGGPLQRGQISQTRGEFSDQPRESDGRSSRGRSVDGIRSTNLNPFLFDDATIAGFCQLHVTDACGQIADQRRAGDEVAQVVLPADAIGIGVLVRA